MWAYHHRDQFSDLDALHIPTMAGRRLDVGGFVFTDPYDGFLRRLSEDYLAEAWSKLTFYLERYQIAPKDLSWGSPHPGETGIPGLKDREPHHFIGLTSQELSTFYLEDKFSLLDEDLAKLNPPLRCIATWRSSKWQITPTDFRRALRLIEALCTDDLWCWSADYALSTHAETNFPWLKIVKAIKEEDQSMLDLAIQEAKKVYSPLGYRIVQLSTAELLKNGPENSKLCLPNHN